MRSQVRSLQSSVNYRMVIGNNEIAQSYGGVNSLPTTFLIGREGRIAKIHEGLTSENQYESEVNASGF
ncbi:MAG TPA: hypothetical protein VFW83_08050 [Bryobacteraceae bacterium]|nr:hypothetical protein [Bryobacteraceae bacterium]